MTNLLAMPLVTMSVVTGTNEDWLDSFKFVVQEGSVVDDYPQLDLTGITFEMEVRLRAPDNDVVLRASTKDGKLQIGDPPELGYLLINISHEEMKYLRPAAYVADITGRDDITVRRCVVIDLEVVQGITRP